MNTEEGKSELSSGEPESESPTAPIEHPAQLDPVIVAESAPRKSKPLRTEMESAISGEPEFQKLDPRHITVELISGSLLSVGVSLAGVVAIVITGVAVSERWIWLSIIAGILVFLFWLWGMTIFWPRLEHRFASWRLDPFGLEIRKGVFWRHRITVPRARVQHVDISQGPLQRKYDLSELTIFTAGTQNSSVKLNGLAHSVATDVRNELISNRDSADVV